MKLNLSITNKCNRACDYCFQGAYKEGPEQRMSVADVERLCHFARISETPTSMVSVLGGEPTLHPDLIEIIDVVRRLNRSRNNQILTNLLCDQEILRELKSRDIGGLVNVGGFPDYSAQQQEQVLSNLAFARKNKTFRWICLAVTITDVNQDFDFVYDILRQDKPRSIGSLRLAISSPGFNFANSFPKQSSLGYGEKYLELVQKCHQIRPVLAFVNECYVNMCMMSERVFTRLQRVVMSLNRYCSGTFDILPDFSTHWCFSLRGVPGMRVDNVLDYKSMDEVCETLRASALNLAEEIGVQCDTANCTNIECLGPCLALGYYRKYVAGREDG